MLSIQNFDQSNRAVRTAEAVTAVRANTDWLANVRPDTLRRFQDPQRAAASIQRAINACGIESYTLAIDSEPIGMATIIEKLRIKHPTRRLGQLAIRQIDYWTSADVLPQQHEEIVDELCVQGGYQGDVLALLTEAEAERAQGIVARMDKLGEPGRVRMPFGVYDRYGLTTVRDPIQTYITTVPNPLMA